MTPSEACRAHSCPSRRAAAGLPASAAMTTQTCIPTVVESDTVLTPEGPSCTRARRMVKHSGPLRKIRRVTVWRPAYQDTFYADLHMYLFATDSLAPVRNPLSESTITVPFGDGIHPVRMDFNLDPPWVLPSLGKYAIAFQPDCFVHDALGERSAEPSIRDSLGSNRTWPYCYVGRFTAIRMPISSSRSSSVSTICATADEGGQATPRPQRVGSWRDRSRQLRNPGGACGAMSSGTCESPSIARGRRARLPGQPGCTVAADPSASAILPWDTEAARDPGNDSSCCSGPRAHAIRCPGDRRHAGTRELHGGQSRLEAVRTVRYIHPDVSRFHRRPAGPAHPLPAHGKPRSRRLDRCLDHARPPTRATRLGVPRCGRGRSEPRG